MKIIRFQMLTEESVNNPNVRQEIELIKMDHVSPVVIMKLWTQQVEYAVSQKIAKQMNLLLK